jgi:hypothetical protein
MAVGVAIVFALSWVCEWANSPVVSTVVACGFVGTFVVLINLIGRRLVRKPPASGDKGATERTDGQSHDGEPELLREVKGHGLDRSADK